METEKRGYCLPAIIYIVLFLILAVSLCLVAVVTGSSAGAATTGLSSNICCILSCGLILFGLCSMGRGGTITAWVLFAILVLCPIIIAISSVISVFMGVKVFANSKWTPTIIQKLAGEEMLAEAESEQESDEESDQEDGSDEGSDEEDITIDAQMTN